MNEENPIPIQTTGGNFIVDVECLLISAHIFPYSN